jgi:hypothetical protein
LITSADLKAVVGVSGESGQHGRQAQIAFHAPAAGRGAEQMRHRDPGMHIRRLQPARDRRARKVELHFQPIRLELLYAHRGVADRFAPAWVLCQIGHHEVRAGECGHRRGIADLVECAG